MATFSSILAWRIPWTEKPGGLQAMELQRVGHDFHFRGFPVSSDGKESACNAGDPALIPGSGKIPGRREWQPTPVFLPGEFHGQRSLECYSLWGCQESDTAE